MDTRNNVAGDWIKMRTDLANDPAVIGIAAACDLDEDAVVGKLHRLWSWADCHSTDGFLAVTQVSRKCHASVTQVFVDRHVRCDGFARAMSDMGWLNITDDGIVSFPKWNTHCSVSAKVRAQSRDRQQRKRSKPVTQVSRSDRDDSVTREEKRREEKSSKVDVDHKLSMDDDAQAEVRRVCNAITKRTGPATEPRDREFVAKLGLLVVTHKLSENDVIDAAEGVRIAKEKAARGERKPVDTAFAYLTTCIQENADGPSKLNALLASVTVPEWLKPKAKPP